MLWQRPGRRALIAVLTVVAALLPDLLIAAVSALGDAPGGGRATAAPARRSSASPRRRGRSAAAPSSRSAAAASTTSAGSPSAASRRGRSRSSPTNVIDAVDAARCRAGVNVRIHVAAAGGTATSNRDLHLHRLPRAAVAGRHAWQRARRAIAAAGCKAGPGDGARARRRRAAAGDRRDPASRRLARTRHPRRPQRPLAARPQRRLPEPGGPAVWMRSAVWWPEGRVRACAEGEKPRPCRVRGA